MLCLNWPEGGLGPFSGPSSFGSVSGRDVGLLVESIAGRIKH